MAKSRTRGFTRGARNTGTTASAATTIAAPEADAPKKKRVNPVQFAKEVRAEARKITWPSRKETWITSVMVGIMVVMASAFLFGADALISFLIGLVLKLAKAG